MHAPLAENVEGIVYADLDLGMISLAKTAADPAGHSARPDVTRLLLDRTPGDRVVLTNRHAAEIGGTADEEATQPVSRSDALAAPASSSRQPG
jgi:aliphatic nitrilase